MSDLLADLPVGVQEALEAAVRTAEMQGVDLYLVGGLVRDGLLGRPSADLDLVVDGGDEARFAEALAGALGAELRSSPAFRTALLRLPGSGRVDVSRARAESYAHPGALPEVRAAGLAEDLARRDFTVNALALRLWPPGTGEIIDRHGGREDLEGGLLRILHERSFEDDPTRILRGLELAVRLGLRFERETREAARAALSGGLLRRISGDRLRRELFASLGTSEVSSVLERAPEIGLLTALHPALDYGERARERAQSVLVTASPELAASVPLLIVTALAWELEESQRQELAELLALQGTARDLLVSGPDRVRRAAGTLSADVPRHRAAEAIEGLSREEVALLLAVGGAAATERARRHVEERGSLELTVRGSDLVERGFSPGPRIGAALRATRRARLDGAIAADQELEFALEVLAREGAEG